MFDVASLQDLSLVGGDLSSGRSEVHVWEWSEWPRNDSEISKY